MQTDPLFKGCVRKPLIWGVPLISALIVMGSGALVGVTVSIPLGLCAVPVLAALRIACAHDEAVLDILQLGRQLSWQFRRCDRLASRQWLLSATILEVRRG